LSESHGTTAFSLIKIVKNTNEIRPEADIQMISLYLINTLPVPICCITYLGQTKPQTIAELNPTNFQNMNDFNVNFGKNIQVIPDNPKE
jgi:hypothetical protein